VKTRRSAANKKGARLPNMAASSPSSIYRHSKGLRKKEKI
jgi:hypothetical protein